MDWVPQGSHENHAKTAAPYRNKSIVRLQVTVQDTKPMQLIQSRSQLEEYRQRVVQRELRWGHTTQEPDSKTEVVNVETRNLNAYWTD